MNTPETTRETTAPREPRAYDQPLASEDLWLCDYLRRTRPELLRAMYRADYHAPTFARD